MSTETQEYSRGYAAGRKKGGMDAEREITLLKAQLNARSERIYMQSLEMVLHHCNGWLIDNKKVNNAEGYCQLAKAFADNAIKILNK